MVATKKLEDKDVYVYEGQIYIPNTYTAGAIGTRVLTSIRDKKRILGMKCTTCNRVLVPARSTCQDCFEPLKEWVEGIKTLSMPPPLQMMGLKDLTERDRAMILGENAARVLGL